MPSLKTEGSFRVSAISLDDSNANLCDKCSRNCPAMKSLELWMLPNKRVKKKEKLGEMTDIALGKEG